MRLDGPLHGGEPRVEDGAPPRNRLQQLPVLVPQRVANLANALGQRVIGDERVRPHGPEQILLRRPGAPNAREGNAGPCNVLALSLIPGLRATGSLRSRLSATASAESFPGRLSRHCCPLRKCRSSFRALSGCGQDILAADPYLVKGPDYRSSHGGSPGNAVEVVCPVVATSLVALLSAALAASLNLDGGSVGAGDPRTWSAESVSTFELPLASAEHSPVHVSSDFYYQLPVWPVYRSYPIYHPDREPPGYRQWLHDWEPEVVFDERGLVTDRQWIRGR